MPDPETPDLQPCPFCGSTIVDFRDDHPDRPECVNCGALGPMPGRPFRKLTEARKASAERWNDRREGWVAPVSNVTPGETLARIDEISYGWTREEEWG